MSFSYVLLVSCCPIVVCEWGCEVSQRAFALVALVRFHRRRTTQSRVAVSHPLTPSHSGREDLLVAVLLPWPFRLEGDSCGALVAVVIGRLGSASHSRYSSGRRRTTWSRVAVLLP